MTTWRNPGAPISDILDIKALIGEDTADNDQATTLVAANRDGSVLERLEQIQQDLTDDSATNFIGVDDSNNVASTSNVAANENGSILERLEQIQEAVNIGTGTSLGANKSLVDALGTDGVTLVDDAASVVGILGVNDSNNAFSSSSVVADRDGSILERTEFVMDSFLALPRAVEKADGTVTAGAGDNLFTITGGPIHVLSIVGIVTTGIEAGAANVKLQITTTTPAATVDMSAGAVDIDGDVAGTSYSSINTTAIFTPVTAGFVMRGNAFATNETQFLCPIGTILLLSDAAKTGNIKWYLRYIPLSENSRVVAAA